MPVQPQSGPPSAVPEQKAASSVSMASLLAFTGGNLDAFLYLDHGHVFAGAMTGNVVLCGIALATRNLAQIAQHSLPIAAFFAGVSLSELLQARLKQHHALIVCLAVEIIGLLIASVLPPSFPDPAFVFLIALLAAFQIGTFSTAEKVSYSSTYVTGDLRTLAVGVYRALNPLTHCEGLHQSRTLGAVLVCFLLGAVSGALISPSLGNRSLLLPSAVLIAALAIILVQLRRSR